MPQSYRDLLQAARALGARGDFRGSARLADDALRQFPDDLELHHLRAAVAERLGDWAGVLQHVARIEAIGAAHEAPAGATTDTTIGAATAATTGPTSDTTADAAHRAVDATPVLRAGGERLATPGERLAAPAALDVMAGWALLQLGRAAEARTRLERATAREPGNATAWVDPAKRTSCSALTNRNAVAAAAALRPDRPAKPILILAVLPHGDGPP
ncbi:MAG: tetratricopeptide repeat protein [Phycisphaerales bacterium]